MATNNEIYEIAMRLGAEGHGCTHDATRLHTKQH